MAAEEYGSAALPGLTLARPPQRVVSLVPSITESLFDLGLGRTLVGVTDYCVRPAEGVRDIPRVGGTKNPRLETILGLQPDLVIVNQEENTPAIVRQLEKHNIPIWLTFPTTVRAAIDILWGIVHLFRSPSGPLQIRSLEQAVEWMVYASRQQESNRYFCPIWQDRARSGQIYWMTFNQETYAHDLLQIMGGINAFSTRDRHHPLAVDLGGETDLWEGSSTPVSTSGSRDVRYPRIALEEIISADPHLILLPSEPYPFDESHLGEIGALLAGTTAVQSDRVHLIDGSLITWHGTRLAKAIEVLPQYFLPPAGD